MVRWVGGPTPGVVGATRSSRTAVRDLPAGAAAISPVHPTVMPAAVHSAKPYRAAIVEAKVAPPRCGSLFAIMLRQTDDLRITQVRPLIPPAILLVEIPLGERASNVISNTRLAVAEAIKGVDPRLVIIAGPCSIHDTAAALDYATALARLAERYTNHLIVVMRSYFAH